MRTWLATTVEWCRLDHFIQHGWCEREVLRKQSPNEHAEQRAKTRSISSISFSFYFHVEVVAQIHTWVVAHIYGEVVVN